MATQKIFEAPIGDGSDDEEPRVAVAHILWKGSHYALFAGIFCGVNEPWKCE
jgi:hypothetical protein